MELLGKNLIDKYLEQKLHGLVTEHWETESYIKSVLRGYALSSKADFSKKSVVLTWGEARNSGNFDLLQNLGDWIFFSRVMFPDSIKCNAEFYESIGRLSYYKCYQLLKYTCPMYEEMADKFKHFVIQVSLKNIDESVIHF